MMKARLISRNLKRTLVDNGSDWRPRKGWRATQRKFLPNDEVRYLTASRAFMSCTDGEYTMVRFRENYEGHRSLVREE